MLDEISNTTSASAAAKRAVLEADLNEIDLVTLMRALLCEIRDSFGEAEAFQVAERLRTTVESWESTLPSEEKNAADSTLLEINRDEPADCLQEAIRAADDLRTSIGQGDSGADEEDEEDEEKEG